MNPQLSQLQTYPFEKLRTLLAEVTPNRHLRAINLAMGEPTSSAPHFIRASLDKHLESLNQYPLAKGLKILRESITQWLTQRFQLPKGCLNASGQVLPLNGSREGLFDIAQIVVNAQKSNPLVLIPNPLYAIYEGAAIMAGATPYYLNAGIHGQPDYHLIPDEVWQDCQLLYVCSPSNPQGQLTSEETWRLLLEKADKFDFVIAADECYIDLYIHEKHPPVGLLQICAQIGRQDFNKCLVFHSLSKRSNVPGLRSGFVAGDAKLIESFLHYRTYHGNAMPLPTQHASIAAWNDTTHVKDNRAVYRAKLEAVADILHAQLPALTAPAAGFYLWLPTPIDDLSFCQYLYHHHHLTVLPGSYLSREAHGEHPGKNHIRIALVAPLTDCVEAAKRLVAAYQHFTS